MQLEQMKHCVSVDIETTGTDPIRHGIISIGAETFVGEHTFYRELILPENCEIDPEALRVNGEDEALLRARCEPDYIKPIHALVELLTWCSQHDVGVMVGKNPDFDHRFLQRNWEAAGQSLDTFNKILTYITIDWSDFIVPLYLWHGYTIPKHGINNMELSRFMKMPDEARPHVASAGARYNVNCVKRVLEMYQENSE